MKKYKETKFPEADYASLWFMSNLTEGDKKFARDYFNKQINKINLKVMVTKKDVLKSFDIIDQYQKELKEKIKELEMKTDNRSIEILGLNNRELNALKMNGINTIGQLLAYDKFDLLRCRNLGAKSIAHIQERLENANLL